MPVTADSADVRTKLRAIQGLALLLVLLIPLAVAALWVAQHGSHGNILSCKIGSDSRVATFVWGSNYVSTPLGNYAKHRFRSFDLESGDQISRERVVGPCIGVGESWAISTLGKDRFELLQWDTTSVNANEPIAFTVPTDDGYRVRQTVFVDGLVIAYQEGSASSRLVLLDPKTSKTLDETEFSGTTDNYLSLIPETNIFRIWFPTRIEIRLGRVSSGKLEIRDDWGTESLWQVVDEIGEVRLVTRSSDRKSLEVQSLSNKEQRTTIELPLPPSGWPSVGPSWVSIGLPIPSTSLDLITGKELPVPAGWSVSARHRTSKRMLVTSAVQTSAQLIDEESGSVIADIAIRGQVIGSRFVVDGERVLIATADQQVVQVDAKTGKILKVIDPYWFIPYLEWPPAIAFFAWACVWLKFSASVHRHAWIDCALLTGLSVGYVFIRSRLTGFADDVVRPIYQLSEGIFASWLIMSSLWLVLGRTRISLRVLPQIAFVGVICLITLACIGFDNPRVWELVIATILLCLWLIVACLPLRFLGYRFSLLELQTAKVLKSSLAKGAIPLRDLFMLTTVLAGVMAVAKIAPPGLRVALLMVVSLFVLVFSVTLTGIAAARVSLSQRAFVWRLLSLVVFALIGMSLPVLWEAANQGWKAILSPDIVFLYWELRLHASTAIATAACLYAFRLRGWRLIRGGCC